MHLTDFTWKDYKISTGFNYRYIDQAPDIGIHQVGVVLCFHGFPDFAYGWRYQIKELTKRGYRVIAPDQLGCGGTSKPDGRLDLKPYSLRAACNAANEILEHEGIHENIIVLGHDWGGAIAWKFIQYFSHRVKCFVSLCTPPTPAAQEGDPKPTWDEVIKSSPTFAYQIWLSSPEADIKVKNNIGPFMQLGYWRTWHDVDYPDDGKWAKVEGELERIYDEKLPCLKKAKPANDEMQAYVDVFEKGGLSGPLNWYKTRFVNYDEDIEFHLPVEFPCSPPCLWLAAGDDMALPPDIIPDKVLHRLFPGGNICKKVAPKGDHWLLQDPRVREGVVQTVADFVDSHVHGHVKTQPSVHDLEHAY
ncbi:hypothetical protein CROQUDRAFT_607050 [Cronartium quercuum f. sp. fusiforme G11]|uniref:AB hydrolase-1 domain-containing protein n=1 Tax=Cronartium quercuum f. sp. fusiforme G11 TaxID=708437 RepID=A0A9P6TA57_9BASI|nr:hypothetical protein CROQUDRAFT_607050 [Cronartium quercuum f. sp. fusiforme G11]